MVRILQSSILIELQSCYQQKSEMSEKPAARLFEPPPKFRLTDAVREQMLPSDSAPKRIFLLSPANIAGIRAGQVMSDHARSDLAIRLRDGGALLGEVFSFISGLYFRGKLAYARAFSEVPPAIPGAFVITACGGLVPPEALVTLEQLREISAAAVDTANASYRRPLGRDSRILSELAGTGCQIVLLGSIATPKYVAPLLEIFGKRLFFPAEFAGRGDMSPGWAYATVRERRRTTYLCPVGECGAAWSQAPKIGCARPPQIEFSKPSAPWRGRRSRFLNSDWTAPHGPRVTKCLRPVTTETPLLR